MKSNNHWTNEVILSFFIIDAVIMDKGVLMITYLGCGDFIDFILILSVIELRGCNKNCLVLTKSQDSYQLVTNHSSWFKALKGYINLSKFSESFSVYCPRLSDCKLYNFQGLIRCLEAGMEILELEAKELEESVLPIWVWVVVSTAILLVLGGVGLGLYLRHR